jgi:hypothetical protein
MRFSGNEEGNLDYSYYRSSQVSDRLLGMDRELHEQRSHF